MNIFQALDALSVDGKRIGRKDREDKNIYIEIQLIKQFCNEPRPYVFDKTGTMWIVPWMMTIDDVRYEDWEIVE